VVVLLREVLLPFIAGMMLAYLLDPLATLLERLGVNRLIATLGIVGLFIVGVVALIIFTAPIVVRELANFVDSFPLYIRQLHGLATNPGRPWLSRIVGEGLGQAEQSVGDLTTLATDWLGTLLHSVWSGGRALISVFSLSVATPVVACYLIYGWNKMIVVIDN
jgi:predicted PurR-regulated permease PerM